MSSRRSAIKVEVDPEDQDGTADGPPGQPILNRQWGGANGIISAYTGVLLLVEMCLVFALTLGEKFLSYQNLTGMLASLAISGIVSVGILLPLAAGVFDVSIAGTMTLSSILVLDLFVSTSGSMPIPVAIGIVLGVCLLVGAFNGYVVVHERVDSFIATIGMGTVLLGISGYVSGATTVALIEPADFLKIGRTSFGQFPITVLYLAVIAAVVWYVMSYTPLGRRIYATGANREAARLSGVRTNRIIFGAFLVSALLAGVAGIIYAARLGAAPPNIGAPYLLPAFSAAFLGSTILQPGRFNVPGLIVAILIVGVGINGLQLYGIAFWIVDFFQGAALVVAVILANRVQGRRKQAL